jgi:hypothetical protein
MILPVTLLRHIVTPQFDGATCARASCVAAGESSWGHRTTKRLSRPCFFRYIRIGVLTFGTQVASAKSSAWKNPATAPQSCCSCTEVTLPRFYILAGTLTTPGSSCCFASSVCSTHMRSSLSAPCVADVSDALLQGDDQRCLRQHRASLADVREHLSAKRVNERLTLASTFLIAYCRYLKCRIKGGLRPVLSWLCNVCITFFKAIFGWTTGLTHATA